MSSEGGWDDGTEDALSDFGGLSDGDNDDDFGLRPSQSQSDSRSKSNLPPGFVECAVLRREDVEKDAHGVAEEVSGLLSVTPGESVLLLVKARWKKNKLIDDFLADDQKVLIDAGLAPEHEPAPEGPAPATFAVDESTIPAANKPAPAPAAAAAAASASDDASIEEDSAQSVPSKRKKGGKAATGVAPKKKAVAKKSIRKSGRKAAGATVEVEIDQADSEIEAAGPSGTTDATPVYASPASAASEHLALASAAAAMNIEKPKYPACVTPSPANFECSVCYCTSGPGQPSVRLVCGHRFCLECMEQQLRTALMGSGQLSNLRCMEVGCKVAVGDAVVRALAKPEELERYDSLLFDSYVFSDPHLRYCPSPQCGRILSVSSLPPASQANNTLPPTATCACGTAVCFTCGEEGGHVPCICALFKLWVKRRAEETANGQWLLVNTKECINCHSAVEKNGGCNHMSCIKCSTHFCWMCLKEWTSIGGYNHKCNAYVDAGKEASISDARRELARYMHYFDRYNAHANSAKLGDKFMKTVEKKMLEMQGLVDPTEEDEQYRGDPPQEEAKPSARFSWIMTQFLSPAATTVLKCRWVLQNSYAMGYYLARDSPNQKNTLELFESIQADLEQNVEKLSGLLEHTNWLELSQSDAEKKRIETLDLQKYCESRRLVVLEDMQRGLEDKRYEWTVKI